MPFVQAEICTPGLLPTSSRPVNRLLLSQGKAASVPAGGQHIDVSPASATIAVIACDGLLSCSCVLVIFSIVIVIVCLLFGIFTFEI